MDLELQSKLEKIKKINKRLVGKPPNIEIRASVNGSEVYIDGKRVEGVESFTLEHDPMKRLEAVLSLRIKNCNFDVSCGFIPLLPAPWNEFYQLKPEYEGLTDEEHLEAERAAKENLNI